MTKQSKRGKNKTHDALPGCLLSPDDFAILSQDILRMIGRGAKLVSYHKRRRRSCWRYADGRYQYVYPVNRVAV